MNLLVRPARSGDTPRLDALYRLGFARYVGQPHVRILVRGATVAEVDGAIVGLGILDLVGTRLRDHLARLHARSPAIPRAEPGDHHLVALVVDPAWRRRGVGRALALARVEIAELRGAGRVFVQCAHGSGSEELYAGLGFRALLRQDRAYADGTGATLMAATLPLR